MALSIIDQIGDPAYLAVIMNNFRECPNWIEEVHPDYRDKLKEVLDDLP